MKPKTFRVHLEPDGEGWHVYFPPWVSIGASTWGYTQEEAVVCIKEVPEMIIEEFEEEGACLPPAVSDETADGVQLTVML